MTPAHSSPTPASPAAAHPLTFMHADEWLLVVEKPGGLLSVPGRGEGGQVNLYSQILTLCADALIVHRLDMATSGLMLFARGPALQRSLSAAFAERRVHKRYEALVDGSVEGNEGEIRAPLAADWPDRPRQKVDWAHGKPSLTRWKVLARADGRTRLALEPTTGRSHQLRVHLQSIGHPICGDPLYAPEPPTANRMMLHATGLGFAHPVSDAPMSFNSPAPF
jgi:tRNA pseudouridine32 synthase/23S rRNA pseudouridine746 synthase